MPADSIPVIGYMHSHPNAVLAGSTFVPYGDLVEMVSADYVGPAVRITAGGHSTTIGPNHPMLSTEGWARASTLRKGDYLVYDRRHERVTPLGHAVTLDAMHPLDLDHVPLVEQAFEALGAIGDHSYIAAAGDDLHHDGQFVKGEVHVVRSNGYLLPVWDAGVIKQAGESQLVWPDAELEPLAGRGPSMAPLRWVYLTTAGDVRWADVRHYVLLRVDEVELTTFVGKAFDATTSIGAYASDGFVVKNCRCVMVPVTKSWTELGYPEVDAAIASGELDGPTPPTSGEDALRSMSRQQQQRTLGLARWNTWKGATGRPGVLDGVGLTMREMSRDVYNEDWGWMLQLDNFDELLSRIEERFGRELAEAMRLARYPVKPAPVKGYTQTTVYTGPLNMDTLAEVEAEWRKAIARDLYDPMDRAVVATDDPRVDAKVAAINAVLASLVKDTEVRIRVPERVLGDILTDGRLRSQFETQTSMGTFDPEVRAEAEDVMFFGEGDAPENEDRPIYGYVSTPKGDETSAIAYGDVVIRLKSDVAARTTITFGDSLYDAQEGSTTATPYVNPTLVGVTVDTYPADVLGWKGPVEDLNDVMYVEAQVHGRVTLNDIAEVVFTSGSGLPNAERSALIARLREAGVLYREDSEWDYARARRDALTPVDRLRPVAATPPAVARETRLPAKPKSPAPKAMYGPVSTVVEPDTEFDKKAVDAAVAESGVSRDYVLSILTTYSDMPRDRVREWLDGLIPTERVIVDAYDRVAIAIATGADPTFAALPPADTIPPPIGLHFDRPTDVDRAKVYDAALVARSIIADQLGLDVTKSKWSGDIVVESRGYPRTGYLNWEGGLGINESVLDSIQRRVGLVTHEILHSFSQSTPASYSDTPGWEEGVAEGLTQLVVAKVGDAMGFDGASIADLRGKDGYFEYTSPLNDIAAVLRIDPVEFFTQLQQTPLRDRPDWVMDQARAADALTATQWAKLFMATRQLDLPNPLQLDATHIERMQARLEAARQVTAWANDVRTALDMDPRTFYGDLLGETSSMVGVKVKARLDVAITDPATDPAKLPQLEALRDRVNVTSGILRVDAGPFDSLADALAGGHPPDFVRLGTAEDFRNDIPGLAPNAKIGAVADAVYAQAAAVEKGITADITGIAGSIGGRVNFLGALDHRLKSIKSIRRKLTDDARHDHVTVAEAATGLKDTVRYTIVSPVATYADTYDKTVAAFEAKGYTLLRTKNFWKSPAPAYQGLNSVFISPDGIPFEVQFHTQDNLRVKEANHPFKEQYEALFAKVAKTLELDAGLTDEETRALVYAAMTPEQRDTMTTLLTIQQDNESTVRQPEGAFALGTAAVRMGPEVTPAIEQRPAVMDAQMMAHTDTQLADLYAVTPTHVPFRTDQLDMARPTEIAGQAITDDGGWLVVRGVTIDALYDADSLVAVWVKADGRVNFDSDANLDLRMVQEMFAGDTRHAYGTAQYVDAAPAEWGPTPLIVTDRSSFQNVRDAFIAEGWRTSDPLTTQPLLTNYPPDARRGAYGHYDANGDIDGILEVHFEGHGPSASTVDQANFFVGPTAVESLRIMGELRATAQRDGLLDHPPTQQQVDADLEADADLGPAPTVISDPNTWLAHRAALEGAGQVQFAPGIHRLGTTAFSLSYYDGTNGTVAYGMFDDHESLIATSFVTMQDGAPISTVVYADTEGIAAQGGNTALAVMALRQQALVDGFVVPDTTRTLPQPQSLEGLDPYDGNAPTYLNSPEEWTTISDTIEGLGLRLTGFAPNRVQAAPLGSNSADVRYFVQTDSRGDVVAVLTVSLDNSQPIPGNSGVVAFRPAYDPSDRMTLEDMDRFTRDLIAYAISRDAIEPGVLTAAPLPPAEPPLAALRDRLHEVLPRHSFTTHPGAMSLREVMASIDMSLARAVVGSNGRVLRLGDPADNTTTYLLRDASDSVLAAMRFDNDSLVGDFYPDLAALGGDDGALSAARILVRRAMGDFPGIIAYPDIPSTTVPTAGEAPVLLTLNTNDVTIPTLAVGFWNADAISSADRAALFRARDIPFYGQHGIYVSRSPGNSTLYYSYDEHGDINPGFAEVFGDGSGTVHWLDDIVHHDSLQAMRWWSGVRELDVSNAATIAAVTTPTLATLPTDPSRAPAPAVPAPATFPEGSMENDGWTSVYSFVRDDISARGIAFEPGVYDVLTGSGFTDAGTQYTWRAIVTADGVAVLMSPAGNIYTNPDVQATIGDGSYNAIREVMDEGPDTIVTPAPVPSVTTVAPDTLVREGRWQDYTRPDGPSWRATLTDATNLQRIATAESSIPVHRDDSYSGFEVYAATAQQAASGGGRYVIVDRWDGDILGAIGVRGTAAHPQVSSFYEDGALDSGQLRFRQRQIAGLVDSLLAEPAAAVEPGDELPVIARSQDITRQGEDDWTEPGGLINTARNTIDVASDGVYWTHDIDGDWGAFSVVDGEVVAYALFRGDNHIGTYVSPFNTHNPTDAMVRDSFNGPFISTSTTTRPPLVVTVPTTGPFIERRNQETFDTMVADLPPTGPVNSVVVLSRGEHVYYNSDGALVLVRFADQPNTIFASPVAANPDDAELRAIFTRAPTPVSTGLVNANTPIERMSLDRYRRDVLSNITLPGDAGNLSRPQNAWATYVDPNTAEVYRVYFNTARYATATLTPDGRLTTYESDVDLSDQDLRAVFNVPEGAAAPAPTRQPSYVPPVTPRSTLPRAPRAARWTPGDGQGWDNMTRDYEFESSTVTVARGLVAAGEYDSVDDVLNGQPNTFAFVGVYDDYGETQGGIFYYGPNGAVVASVYAQFEHGGDVTADNPDGWRVAEVHYVRTHPFFQRLNYSTRLYEWATTRGFQIERESGIHGLTEQGGKYWRSRRAKPFSRVTMAVSRMRPELGAPASYDDVLALRRTKAIRDSARTLPGEIAAGLTHEVALLPSDVPTKYQLGKSSGYDAAIPSATDPLEVGETVVVRLLPHTEEAIGYYAGTPEPSQDIEFDPSSIDNADALPELDWAAAYAVRKGKQDSVIVTLVGAVVSRAGLDPNGQSVRIEGIDPARMREVYDDLTALGVPVTIHDQSGMVEASVYDADMTVELAAAFAHLATYYGARVHILPANIRFYWHDKQAQDAAKGWFHGPDDASFTATDIKAKLRAVGTPEALARANRIIRRRSTSPVRAGEAGGVGGDGSGDGAGAGDAARGSPEAGAIAAFPRTTGAVLGPRGQALASPTTADARAIHDTSVEVFYAITQVTGLTNQRWTGDVEVVPAADAHGWSAQMAWNGTLRVSDEATSDPRWLHILTHEMLHAATAMTQDDFIKNRWLEEGVVEMLARDIDAEVADALLEEAPGLDREPYADMVTTLEAIRRAVGVPTRTFYLRLNETPLGQRAALITDWVAQRAGAPHSLQTWAQQRYAMNQTTHRTDASLKAEYDRWEQLRSDLHLSENEFYADMASSEDMSAWLGELAFQMVMMSLAVPSFPATLPDAAARVVLGIVLGEAARRWAASHPRPFIHWHGKGPNEFLKEWLARLDAEEQNGGKEKPDVRDQVTEPASPRPRTSAARQQPRAVQRSRGAARGVARRRA